MFLPRPFKVFINVKDEVAFPIVEARSPAFLGNGQDINAIIQHGPDGFFILFRQRSSLSMNGRSIRQTGIESVTLLKTRTICSGASFNNHLP